MTINLNLGGSFEYLLMTCAEYERAHEWHTRCCKRMSVASPHHHMRDAYPKPSLKVRSALPMLSIDFQPGLKCRNLADNAGFGYSNGLGAR